MGIIKGPNAHALSLHESNNTCNPKTKKTCKGKTHVEPKKEGNSKPYDDSSSSKGGKGNKGKTKSSYYNHDYHPMFACMKKHIDHMTHILQKNNLGDHIPEAAKKKLEDQAK